MLLPVHRCLPLRHIAYVLEQHRCACHPCSGLVQQRSNVPQQLPHISSRLALHVCHAKKKASEDSGSDPPDAAKKRTRKATTPRAPRKKKSEASSEPAQPQDAIGPLVASASSIQEPPAIQSTDPSIETASSNQTASPAAAEATASQPATAAAAAAADTHTSEPPEPSPSTSYSQEIIRKTPEQLALNRQGYQAFEMDGVEFLVSETANGWLSLKDCYVFEASSDLYSQPEMLGEIPAEHTQYQCMPWTEEYLGDTLSGKPGWVKIQKMIFIPVESTMPYQLRMEDVFIFSASTRQLVKADVQQVGPRIIDPILRIREDRVTIEDSSYAPDFKEVVDAAAQDRLPRPAIDDQLLRDLEIELAEYQVKSPADTARPL